MIFNTTRFGDVDLPDSKIIHFSEGLFGFEKEKKLVLLPFVEGEDCPLEWMQSVKTPELAFVVTDPKIFVPDYLVNLDETEKAEIGLFGSQSFALRVIVTVPDVYIDMTANLAGPLIINPEKMIGKQFVLTNSQYDIRHNLFPTDIHDSKGPVS